MNSLQIWWNGSGEIYWNDWRKKKGGKGCLQMVHGL